MSISAFLDLIRRRLSPSEGKIILESLTQDPLVWQFVQNEEKSIPYFESMPDDIQIFSPGAIALWLIEQELNVSLPEAGDISKSLPGVVRQRAAKAYQTVINTGLPPIDLLNAGLLALTLRERRQIKKSWHGIVEEIFKNTNPSMVLKYYQTWRTPFACLFGFCSDIDDLRSEFTGSKRPLAIKTAVPILLHAYLANPVEPENLLDKLFTFCKGLSIEGQLECLQWVDSFDRSSLQKALASHLMQTRENQTYFAEIFTELESLDSFPIQNDPLEKPIRFSLPERLNRLAAFHYHSGDQAKAVETYQKSCDLINTIQSQTRFQSLIIQDTNATSSAWMKMIQNLPNSNKAHLFHIRSLIENRNFEEAREKLANVPDSPDKQLLDLMLDHQNEAKSEVADNKSGKFESESFDKSLPSAEFFVRTPSIISSQEIANAITKIKDTKQRLSILRKIINSKSRDPEFLTLARDQFERAGLFNPALETASYLERLEPEKVEHQRSLAGLYCKVGRWQDAFSLLQKMIRNVSEPESSDLAAFAESALMTGRTDMAISICQNILSQENDNPKALILLGKSYMEKGDVVKAIQHMEQVVALIPDDPKTWIHLARFWENSGQTDRAFEILRQGILAIPDDPELLHEIGRAHLEKASPTEARGYLRKAFEADPSNNEIRFNLSRAEYQLGDYEKAHEMLNALPDSYETDFSIAQLLGNVLLAMGETEKAEPVLLSAAQQNPAEVKTVLKVADIVLGHRRAIPPSNYEEHLVLLEEILNSALEEHPDNNQLKLCFADLNRLMGEHEKAHNTYTKLAMSDHTQKDLPGWRVQYGLGLTSTALGDVEIGLAALQDAALTETKNLDVLHALAETYIKADLRDKALESAKSALSAAPQDVENLIWYANFNASQNRIDIAVKAFREALQLAPDRLEIKYLYAKTLIEKGDVDESFKQLEQLTSNENASAELLHQAAYLFIRVQKLNRAEAVFEKAADKCEQSNPVLLMDLAVLNTLMDQRKKALEIFDLHEGAIQKFPQLGILKADLLSEIGQYSSALKILDLIKTNIEHTLEKQEGLLQKIKQSPLLFRYDFSYKGYLFRYGQLNRATGNLEEAQQVLEKAVKAAPDAKHFVNALVSAYTASLDNAKALQQIEAQKLLAQNFDDLDINQLDMACSQMEILLEQGDDVRVRAVFEQPAPYTREYPRIFAIKSRLAAADGDISQAAEYLGRAIEDYDENFRDNNPATPSELFRMLANLQGITDASSEIEDFNSAHQYQSEAWKKLNNQPDINFRYAQLITLSAEKQQVAQAIKLIEHAPGPQFLDDKYYQLGKGLLEGLRIVLPNEKLMCLQARLSSAFSGKWPKHLSADNCFVSPEMGAAYIIGSEDSDRVVEIVSAFPESIPVLQASAIFTLKTGKGDGQAAIQKALQKDTANPINHALHGLINISEPELAVNSFETALQFWPDEPEWHRILADLYTDLGNTEKATEHITQAIESQPENGTYWQTRAGIHLKLNHLELAKTDLEKSTQLQSQDPGGWISMADVNRRLGNISEAAENMTTAVSLKPEDNDIALQEIEFLLEQQQYQKAEDKAAKRINQKGDNRKLHILLARSRAKLGDFDRALGTLNSLQDQNSADAEVKLEAIKIMKDRDGVEKLLPDLINLADQYPEHPEILTTLTDWLIQANRLDEAQETAQTILRIIPDSAEVHLMLGRLQRIRGQLDQAIAHLSDAIAHDPDLVEAYIELGKAYQDRRNLEEAIKTFQMGSSVDASDPRPYYHAAMALKSCKDYSGAEAMLKQAKRYAPGDANIIRQLGVITALNLINNLRETR